MKKDRTREADRAQYQRMFVSDFLWVKQLRLAETEFVLVPRNTIRSRCLIIVFIGRSGFSLW